MLTHCLDDTITPFRGFISSFMVSWLLNFTECRCVLALLFGHLQHRNYIQIIVTTSIPVNQLTAEEADKEYSSLMDKIAAKYQQLDSSKFGAVGTSAFDAKSPKLASLFACMSQLCQRLYLPIPIKLHRLPFFKH